MRGAGRAGVPASSKPLPFPPVSVRRRPGGGAIWASVPTGRVTLAKWLLHAGPQFPHLYSGEAEEGVWGNLEASKQLSGGGGGGGRGGTPPTPGSYSPRLRGRSSPRAPSHQQITAGTAPGSQAGDSRRCAHPYQFWGRGERLDS